MTASADYHSVYRQLLAHYGPQGWWPGDSPFEVMVGAILTQNTAWTNVEKAIANIKAAAALDPDTLATQAHDTVAQWLRPSGYFNIKSRRLQAFCHWLLEQGGEAALAGHATDQLREDLLGVHGIGPETADDILLYAFDRPVFVVDAYTRRLFARLGLIAGDEPYEQIRAGFERALDGDAGLYNEYHALIVIHAKDTCRKQARCDGCPLAKRCPSAGQE